MGQTIRIDESDHATLAELARIMGKSMTATLSDAIDALRRREFLRQTNEAYARLRDDPNAWREEEEERAAWDATLADGLEDSTG